MAFCGVLEAMQEDNFGIKRLPINSKALKRSLNFSPIVVLTKSTDAGTSLVVQWLRIRLLMQGTWVWSLAWEDPTCRGVARSKCHNYWDGVLELQAAATEAHLPSTGALHQEKPPLWEADVPQLEELLLTATRKNPHAVTKTQPKN